VNTRYPIPGLLSAGIIPTLTELPSDGPSAPSQAPAASRPPPLPTSRLLQGFPQGSANDSALLRGSN